jgi:hypothetical protein
MGLTSGHLVVADRQGQRGSRADGSAGGDHGGEPGGWRRRPTMTVPPWPRLNAWLRCADAAMMNAVLAAI